MNKWLENDIVLRIISVALAVILWLSVSDSSYSFWQERGFTSSQTRVEVPIEAKYDESRYELVKLIPNKVQLILTGDSYLLERLSLNYRVFVDLTKLGSGSHNDVPLQVEGVPVGIDKKLSTTTVDVVLEEKIKKELPVQVDVVGSLKDGYKLGTPIVTPNKVVVSGTKSQLEEVKSIRAVVQVNKLDQIRGNIRLQPFGDHGPLSLNQISLNPEVVHVEIPISVPGKKVPLNVEVIKNAPAGYAIEEITTKPTDITVYGPQTYLNTLSYYSGVQLDLSKVTKSTTLKRSVVVRDPATKVEPKEVEIYVKMVPSQTKQIENVPIQLNGIPEGVIAEFAQSENGNVSLEVSGAPSLVQNIGAGDIKAYVDLSNLSLGSHEVPIQFGLPSYVKVQNQEKLKVNIQLKKR